MEYHFMVELDYFNPEVYEKGSFENELNIILNHLRNSGKVQSLSLSHEDAIIWVVLKLDTEEELIELLDSIPLPYEISYEYYFLNHYEVIQEISSFSLN
jgi:hypothetical protein